MHSLMILIHLCAPTALIHLNEVECYVCEYVTCESVPRGCCQIHGVLHVHQTQCHFHPQDEVKYWLLHAQYGIT